MSPSVKLKTDLKNLNDIGDLMEADLILRMQEERKDGKSKSSNPIVSKLVFEAKYQRWYTESWALIKQTIPDRLAEFISLYLADPKRKIINSLTYSIQDWLNGINARVDILNKKAFEDLNIVYMRFATQRKILDSATAKFESSLLSIQQIVQADLFDSEIDGSKELHKNGFLRGAGIIAGVVLEKHLAVVCLTRSISIKKKDPSLSDFNESLKASDVIDIPTWRFLQRLSDIRNLCGHNKNREPTSDEVLELINGADRIIKSIY